MEQIDFRDYKVACSKNDDLRHQPQRIQIKYKIITTSGVSEVIPVQFICGFNDECAECKKCKSRILEIFNNRCYVPKGTVISIHNTAKDFPPLV